MILKKNKGILPSVDKVGAKCYLSEELKKQIEQFYLGDESSFELVRIMPGQKDYVSLLKNIHAQKDCFCVILTNFILCIASPIQTKRLVSLLFIVLDQSSALLYQHMGHTTCVCVHYTPECQADS